MNKFLSAILCLITSSAINAHEWEPDAAAVWTVRLIQNHNEIIRCIGYINQEKREAYKQSCHVNILVDEENDLIREIGIIRNKHHDMSDPDFMLGHFPSIEDDPLYVYRIAHSIRQIEQARTGLIYIALVDEMWKDE